MMNPGDILKTRLATPEQVELVRVAIREELSKFSGEGFGERERIYDLRRFFRFNNPDIRTDLIATTIFDAVTGAVGFTDTEAEWFSRDIYAFIHHELIKLLGRGEKNCWLESHSLLRRCPDDSPTLRFSELKLDAGPSALLFSHMDGETCQRLARTNHYYDKAISAHLGAVVRSSLNSGRGILYAVPDREGFISGRFPSISTRVSACKEALKAKEIRVFLTKEEATMYAKSESGGHESVPIITLIRFQDVPVRFDSFDLPSLPCSVFHGTINPQACIAIGSEFLHRVGSIAEHGVLLRTHTYLPAQIQRPVLNIAKLTRHNREAGHNAFIKSISHRPLMIEDFIYWLDTFYCDHYLAHKINGARKVAFLKACVQEIRQAQKLGLDLGTDINEFLNWKPLGIDTLKELIRTTRPNYRETYVRTWCNNDSWGWDMIKNTFLGQSQKSVRRYNRDKQHQIFMNRCKMNPPTLDDFIRWLKVFYLINYLGPSHYYYDPKSKYQLIESVVYAHQNGQVIGDGSIAAFLEHVPEGSTQSLKDLISICRRGEKNKVSWGWKTIEASFLEPERAWAQASNSLKKPGVL